MKCLSGFEVCFVYIYRIISSVNLSIYRIISSLNLRSGAPGLVVMVFAVHAGSRGSDSHRRHMSERFFRPNRPGYPHPVCSELEKSGIRVAVGDCSVTECRRWRPLYQIDKTVHVHADILETRRRRTHGAGCARPWYCTAEPLGERRYENRITQTHTKLEIFLYHFQLWLNRNWFVSLAINENGLC